MSRQSVQPLLAQIQQFQQLRNFPEALRIAKSALLSNPEEPELLNIAGVTSSQNGKHMEALDLLSRAVAKQPSNYVFKVNLGSVYAALEKYDEAEKCFRSVVAINPSLPEAHFNLGNALKDLRKPLEAIESYRKAIQLRPGYAAAWSNLGAIYLDQAKVDEAKTSIQRALSLNPRSPSALNNQAGILRSEGQIAKSIELCLAALTVNPNYAEAYFSLGAALVASLDFARGIIAYEKGASLKPASKSTLFELVNAYSATGTHEGIVQTLARILDIDPADARAHMLLGVTQMERGYYAEAKAAFEKSISIKQDAATMIRFALAIPPIAESAEQIIDLRKEVLARLGALPDNLELVEDPYSSQLGPNFFLAYHALNDREIQSKVAALYRRVSPSLTYCAPHCAKNPEPKSRIRVGFISRYIYKHSVSIAFAKDLSRLSQDPRIEAFLISTTDHSTESAKSMYKDFSGAFVYVPTMLPFARQAIASLELDVLVYLDLGMDPFTFLLAFARLARVQAVLSGHPDTTGIDTVDCFLSPAILEGEQAETHYTEQLVRLQSAKFSFPKPDVPKPLKSRAELGLPTSGRIYFCPMMLQKIHPDFDQTIASILSLDLEAHVILCDSFQHPRWSVLLRERLAKIIPSAHLKRLTFIPWIHDTGDFLAAIAASDVILDPFHFGIGTTGAYCFSVGTPIVTWPGEFMRGRAGLAYCEELDLMDCVAACQEEYASLAVRIASDKALHASIKDRILANNHRLFGENSVANEIAEFFLSRVNSLGPATESAGQ